VLGKVTFIADIRTIAGLLFHMDIKGEAEYAIGLELHNRDPKGLLKLGRSVAHVGRREIWYFYTIPPSTNGWFSIIRLGPKIERSNEGTTFKISSERYLPTAGPC